MKKILVILAFLLFILICSGTAMAANLNTSKPATTTKLVFIHHSCGSNWLADGDGNLAKTLNQNKYYVSECGYGWDAATDDSITLGDNTNTDQWKLWFNDKQMHYVYNHASPYSNRIANPGGENEVIMFKSCFPCSEVGSSITDEKTEYNRLLPYFAAHQNKFFVLITPPGETKVDSHILTRQLCNWLVDKDNGWLKNYSGKNVMVFDFYGVLSETGSHHRVVSDHVEHVYASNYDGISPYHNGDDHPNYVGNQKATAEFIPLLNYAYNLWKKESPGVISIDPARYSANVPYNKLIKVTFNKPIKAGSNFWVELKDSAGKVIPIYKSITGSNLYIRSVSALKEAKYYLTLHAGCVTDLNNNLSRGFTSYFVVGTSPIISSSNPVNNALKVPRNQVITLVFSEAIKKSSNCWIELKSSTGKLIFLTSSVIGNKLTIKHYFLAAKTRYALIFHGGCLTDLVGNPLKSQIRYFTTGIA